MKDSPKADKQAWFQKVFETDSSTDERKLHGGLLGKEATKMFLKVQIG